MYDMIGIQKRGFIVDESGKIIAWVNPHNENINDYKELERKINDLERRIKDYEIKQTMQQTAPECMPHLEYNINTRRAEQEGTRARDAIIEAFEKGFKN